MCYKCESYSGACEDTETCNSEDACLSLRDPSQFFITVLMQLFCLQYCPHEFVEVVRSGSNTFKTLYTLKII